MLFDCKKERELDYWQNSITGTKLITNKKFTTNWLITDTKLITNKKFTTNWLITGTKLITNKKFTTNWSIDWQQTYFWLYSEQQAGAVLLEDLRE